MPHVRTTEGELDRPPTAHRIITLIAVVASRRSASWR